MCILHFVRLRHEYFSFFFLSMQQHSNCSNETPPPPRRHHRSHIHDSHKELFLPLHSEQFVFFLLNDLKEILQLKATIDQIKEEAQDPHLDAETKLDKLKELQDALERLQNLRANVIKTEGKAEETEEEETEQTKGNIFG